MPVTVDEVRDILFIPTVVPMIALPAIIIYFFWYSIYEDFKEKTLTKKSFLFRIVFSMFLMWGGWGYGNMYITDYINGQVNVTVGYVERSNSGGSRGVHRNIHVENHTFSFTQFFGYPELRSGITYRIYYTPRARVIIRAVPIN